LPAAEIVPAATGPLFGLEKQLCQSQEQVFFTGNALSATEQLCQQQEQTAHLTISMYRTSFSGYKNNFFSYRNIFDSYWNCSTIFRRSSAYFTTALLIFVLESSCGSKFKKIIRFALN
jgi:hypothetical protein